MAVNTYESTFYPETRFGGFSNLDGTLLFYVRINVLARPHFRVLDFGCGRGAQSEDPIPWRREMRTLRGRVARVIGLDVDPVGAENPTLDEFHQLDPQAGTWPVESSSVNLIICDNVIEHLPDPARFFDEAHRVLAPGGYLCIRTPNRLSYVGIASSLLPNRHHARVLTRVQANRQEKDVFPTLYRCNTVRAVRRELKKRGLEAVVLGYEAEPSYLHFSKLAYFFGVLHQRFAPSVLRPAIFAFAQKPSTTIGQAA